MDVLRGDLIQVGHHKSPRCKIHVPPLRTFLWFLYCISVVTDGKLCRQVVMQKGSDADRYCVGCVCVFCSPKSGCNLLSLLNFQTGTF